jgi:hypothetical protein
MNTRVALTLLLVLAGLALAAGLVWVIFQFALPGADWVTLGPLEDFPPSDEPYAVRDVYVFLVNDGVEITVLDPLNPAPGGVNVRWNSVEGAFIDPQRGSWFSLYGIPKRRAGVNSILENQSLYRYPLKIENGKIYIDLSRSKVIDISTSGLP